MTNDPSALSRWVAAHPVLWSASTGLAMAGLGLLLFGTGSWALAAVVGVCFASLNIWLWRSGGPGHRWRASLLRRFPKTDNRH